MTKKRVLSGIRATGRLHLGNYLGAVRGMLALQKDPAYETLYMVADLHSINTPYDITTFQQKVRDVVLDYLSAELDPEKSTIFIQSQVPEHVELSYLFSSVLTVARMLHLPTYKDKIKENPENANMAMLYYPVLMAADILIYKADSVPVGDDQLPHLEVAREVARKMNERFGTDFPEPVQFKTEGHYVPSLTGEGKMSKSVEGSYINLTDSPDEVRKKIRSVPTATVSGGEMTPGVKTLFALAKLFLSEIEYNFFKSNYDAGKLPFVSLKDGISKNISKELLPIQERRKELEGKPDYVNNVIKVGAEKARAVASETLKEMKAKMGLI